MAKVFTADDLLQECEEWLGTPYVHQHGKKRLGADCLGFVLGVVSKFAPTIDIKTPKYSANWCEVTKTDSMLEGAKSNLLVSDGVRHGSLVTFKMVRGSVSKHCGIMFSDGGSEFLYHSIADHGVVKSGMTSDWLKKISGVFLIPGVLYVER